MHREEPDVGTPACDSQNEVSIDALRSQNVVYVIQLNWDTYSIAMVLESHTGQH